VDLESHRPIDLLPDRRAETAAHWMRQHPEITAVSRDRGGEYAKAAAQGAPQAVQCADRFHLCKNLSEAAQLLASTMPSRNRSAQQQGRARETRAEQTGHFHRRMASS